MSLGRKTLPMLPSASMENRDMAKVCSHEPILTSVQLVDVPGRVTFGGRTEEDTDKRRYIRCSSPHFDARLSKGRIVSEAEFNSLGFRSMTSILADSFTGDAQILLTIFSDALLCALSAKLRILGGNEREVSASVVYSIAAVRLLRHWSARSQNSSEKCFEHPAVVASNLE